MLKTKSNKIALGVNIDHAATLRQVRGGTTPYPDLIELTRLLKKSGATQVTIHLREDRRHIQDKDVVEIVRARILPVNLELAPSQAMFHTIESLKSKWPNWICFVPEKRKELTTEGGLDVVRKAKVLRELVSKCRKNKVLVSFFIDANLRQVEESFLLGADAVEFHTGAWVEAKGLQKSKHWKALCAAAKLAHQLGLRVHAGHGLDVKHAKMIRSLPHLLEVNIGHSLICRSLFCGIHEAIREMHRALKK